MVTLQFIRLPVTSPIFQSRAAMGVALFGHDIYDGRDSCTVPSTVEAAFLFYCTCYLVWVISFNII